MTANTNVMKSRLCSVLAVLVATMLSTLGTAEANVFWWTGLPGAYGATPTGVCNYYDVNGRRLVVRPKTHPYILARNSTAGTDVQWVRYTPYVEDMNGNLLMWGNSLPFRQASDTVPAAWSVAELPKLTLYRQHFRLVLYIEWWNQQNQLVGTAYDRLQNYYEYHMGSTFPSYGPYNSCAYLW